MSNFLVHFLNHSLVHVLRSACVNFKILAPRGPKNSIPRGWKMHPISGTFSEPENVHIFWPRKGGQDYGAEKWTNFGARKMRQNLNPFSALLDPPPGNARPASPQNPRPPPWVPRAWFRRRTRTFSEPGTSPFSLPHGPPQTPRRGALPLPPQDCLRITSLCILGPVAPFPRVHDRTPRIHFYVNRTPLY